MVVLQMPGRTVESEYQTAECKYLQVSKILCTSPKYVSIVAKFRSYISCKSQVAYMKITSNAAAAIR